MIESSPLFKIKKISFIIPCGISIALITAISLNVILTIIWILIWSSTVGLIMLKFSQHERMTIMSFLLAGLLIRLLIASLFRYFYASTEGLITPDEFYYFEFSKYLAQEWKNGNLFKLQDIQHAVYTRNYGFHIYSALHFLIFEDKLFIVISNIFLDIISSLIIYKFLSENLDEKFSKLAFILFIFNPHQIYWSTFILKDTLL